MNPSTPMPFGKYRRLGRTIGQVPLDYWSYLLDQGALENRPELKAFAEAKIGENERRVAVELKEWKAHLDCVAKESLRKFENR